MKKIILIIVALSVALCILNPNIDIYAYFVNIVENFPDFKDILGYTMNIFKDFVNSASLLENNFSWNELGNVVITFLHFIFDFLIIAPCRLLWWIIQFVGVIFGGLL